MNLKDYFESTWDARARLLDACASLTREEWTREFPFSWKTVQRLFGHIIEVERSWMLEDIEQTSYAWGGDEARERAEVLLRHDIRAATRLVRSDCLRVRHDDDRQHGRDRDRDRQDEIERSNRDRDEDDHRRFGRVGDRGEWIRREDRKGERLRDQGLVHLAGRPRAPDYDPLRDLESVGRLRRGWWWVLLSLRRGPVLYVAAVLGAL